MHRWEGAVKKEKFPCIRMPFTGRDGGWWGGKIGSHRGEYSNRAAQGKAERFLQRRSVPTQHSPAGEACVLTCRGGWGLGGEARASEFRSQGEDCSWLHEHNLKGASVTRLARRESRKKSGSA